MAEGAPPKNGYEWMHWARTCGLNAPQQPILVVVSTHCKPDGTTWLSYQQIADESGYCRRAVINAMASLERAGYLSRAGLHSSATGHGHVIIWRLNHVVQRRLLPTVHAVHPGVQSARQLQNQSARRCIGTTLRTTHRSQITSGDLTEVPAMTSETPRTLQACRQRFLASDNRKEQVAALVDASRLLFAEPLAGGRAAAFVGRYGHGQNVIDALMAAAGHGAAGPADYMEKVLQGSKQRREGGQRVASGEAVTRFVERREEMWG